MKALSSISSLFRNAFNKMHDNTGAQMLDSIHYEVKMTLKSHCLTFPNISNVIINMRIFIHNLTIAVEYTLSTIFPLRYVAIGKNI